MTLDDWITGSYGEDHPDNQDDRSDRERHEATLRAIDAERAQTEGERTAEEIAFGDADQWGE